MAEPETKKQAARPKWERWAMIIGVVVIFAVTASVFRKSITASDGFDRIDRPEQAEPDRQFLMPRQVEVSIGTNWYNPNTKSLHIHIWGHPSPNVGNGVPWRMRYNYDDRTIVEMPAIGPVPKYVEFKGDIWAIEYSLALSMGDKMIPFTFFFDPPK